MPLPGPLVEARFVERPNRFLIRCRVAGEAEVQEVHLADPGRLRELLVAGARVMVHPASGATRRTRWTAVLVEVPGGGGWIGLRTTLPNDLIGVALRAGSLPELAGWTLVRAEWPHGRSRFDFLLESGTGRRMALEVKGVTLVTDGVARFPDAVSARATRHVHELADLVRGGTMEAAVLFVLQREDAASVEAAGHIDPAFAEALREAAEAGVRLLGRRCRVSLDEVMLGGPVPAGRESGGAPGASPMPSPSASSS